MTWEPWDAEFADNPHKACLVIYHPMRDQIEMWVKAYDIGGAPVLQVLLDMGWEVVGEL